jgi:hypothetical protein
VNAQLAADVSVSFDTSHNKFDILDSDSDSGSDTLCNSDSDSDSDDSHVFLIILLVTHVVLL